MKNVTFLLLMLLSLQGIGQNIPAPIILEVKEDDRVATIYWNSKTDSYNGIYDPWKQQGISSYVIEWGKVDEGFTNTMYSAFRVIQCQPLTPGVMYQARIYALDNYGVKSEASVIVQFQHDGSRVEAMRNRLTGFFDDFNLPMGAFDELNWNQAYSGCGKLGYISQHINNQFHAHNVLASGPCDRGMASSRPRRVFDFTNRTGIIEFDLDGGIFGSDRWFLDLTPADRKRDLSGFVSATPIADAPFLLRISNSDVRLADANGELFPLPNMYENDACGFGLEWCPGENLQSIANVRRHFRIELSKTDIKMFINDILVVDASLQTSFTPNGLPYEVAQLNWVLLSYDTGKSNHPIAMIHWDNFGFDAPAGWQATKVIHNYTDGKLATDIAEEIHHVSNGMETNTANPAQSEIPIPDSITDQNGNMPVKAELMFTLQSGNYEWNSSDFIKINNQAYPFNEPVSSINNYPFGVVFSTTPYSALLTINLGDLLTGNNVIEYHLSNAKILNVHIELTYPIDAAPSYTQPSAIYNNHTDKLMEFLEQTKIGPSLTIPTVNGMDALWTPDLFPMDYDNINDYRMLVMQSPVSGLLQFDVSANSNAQMAAKGITTGISHYKVFIDEQVVQTVYTNAQAPISYFWHNDLSFDTRLLSNGEHFLYVEAYDVYNRPSVNDLFLKSTTHGEYVPIAFTVNNICNQSINLNAGWNLISFNSNAENNAVANVFDDLIATGNLEFVTGYDNGAKVFDPFGPPFLNTLTEVADGFGYWIKLANVDVLNAGGGCLPIDYKKPLDAGWNLIAYQPITPQSPADYFADLIAEGNLEFVTGFDNGTKTFDPNGPPFLNTLTNMQNGFGYWAKVTNASAKTSNNQTNVFSFINGTSNLANGEQVTVLNEAGETIANMEVIEDGYLMTTPIYGDDETTAIKEYINKGENLRFSWNGQTANFATTFKGDYGIEKVHLEFKLDKGVTSNINVFPNPLTEEANIVYHLERPENVTISLFNASGKHLINLIKDQTQQAGDNQIKFTANDLSTGIYYLKFESNENNIIKKLVKAK